MDIIPRTDIVCQETGLYQLHTDRREILSLADHALTQANQYRQEWLAGGDPQAWQLWQACVADRVALLEQMEVGT